MEITLFGGFGVARDGRPLPPTTWRRRRAADLLALVALQRGRALHREVAIEALWPHKDPGSGANNLHRALHDLRRQLGGEVVGLDKGVLRLTPEAWVDVLAFEEGVEAGDPAALAGALDLYRGDLYPEEPYAPWLEGPREGLRRRFAEGTLRLARELLGSGRAAEAVTRLQRLLELEETDEEAHRLLVSALAECGRREEALRQCERCREAMQRLLGARPGTALEDLCQHLKQAPSPPAPTGAQRLTRRLLGRALPRPLIGRELELAEIDAFVGTGRGLLVLLGEAGVGKTRLAAEAATRAEGHGAVLASAVGLELERLTPYAPFVEAWSDLLRSQGRPAEENPFLDENVAVEGEPRESKYRLFRKLEQGLEALAAGAPLLLVLDDVHWFDESSLQLVRYLASQTGQRPWMLVLTCRQEAAPAGSAAQGLLTWLRQRQRARPLHLAPLDAGSTRRQCEEVLGRAVPAEVGQAVHRLSEGNPFYTEEIAFTIGLSPGAGDERRVGVPPNLGELFRDRLESLAAPTRRLLVAGAVAGRRFELKVVARASGLDPAAAEAACADAAAARLVEQEGGDAVRFAHALAREAIYGALPPAERRRLHQELAVALAERAASGAGAAPMAIAHHFRAAGEPARALPYLGRAARQAREKVGFEEAAAIYRQSVELMDEIGVPAGPERFHALGSLGQLLNALADVPGAVAALDAAAALCDPASGWRPEPAERARMRRLAAMALVTGGELAQAEQRLERARQELAGAPDHPEHPQLLYHLAQLRWHEERYRESYELAEECLRAAERLGEPQQLSRAYEMLALACHSLGEWQEGLSCEQRRGALTGGNLDVASAFDVHL